MSNLESSSERLKGIEPTRRFSSRVADYVLYRPSYPADVVVELEKRAGLGTNHLVADIGSGTGKLTEIFLRGGYKVIGVEPNREMRLAGDQELARFERFSSVDGSAEATNLADGSVDAIVVAQAFHWFDIPPTRQEFLRVLRGPRLVALIWNDRETVIDQFAVDYDALLEKHCPEYGKISSKWVDESRTRELFKSAAVENASFPNEQRFDFAGLRGRLMSSSYAPIDGPAHHAMIAGLRAIFDRHQVNGKIRFGYQTRVFWGRLSEQS